jgi:hypothetical protein
MPNFISNTFGNNSGSNAFINYYRNPGPAIDLAGIAAYADNLAKENFRREMTDSGAASGIWEFLLEPAAAPIWSQIASGFLPNSNVSAETRMANVSWAIQQAGASRSSSGSGGSGYNVAQATEQFKAVIGDYQGQMGLEGNYDDLAATAAANHWSPDMLRDALAAHITMQTAERPGIVHDAIDKIRGAASEYLVSYNDDELLDYAKRIAANDLNVESAVGDVRDRAKQQYSWLSNTIDSGTTLKQYFQPHREAIAKLLELGSGENVNLMDTKWRDIVHKMPSEKDPIDRSLTVAETERYVRQMNEWRSTNNAKAAFSGGAVALGRVMGKIA